MTKTDSHPYSNNSVSIGEKKPSKLIHELEGRCAYFPHADYHNLKAFNFIKEISDNDNLAREINDRLLHYLLIYDVIIMHSSDPLRSEIIYNILNDNSLFIENGTILFVFSTEINDITSDYETYIQRKINEYKENKNSKLDIDSLEQKHMTNEYYRKTIELLEKSKYILKKNQKGSITFKELIKLDLQEIEPISINIDKFFKSGMKLLSLSLWQLLNLMEKSTKGYIYVFPNEAIKEFIADWEQKTENGLPFSRHTITSELREMIIEQQVDKKKIKYPQKHLLYAIENRLNLLYSKLNCMEHYILEMNPNLEKHCSYSYYFLKLFLFKIAGKNIKLNKDIVLKIRKSNEWQQFIQLFALSMCDLEMAIKITHPLENKYSVDYMPTDALYKLVLGKINPEKYFSEINKILLEESL
jgi:hypothetical protein